jgi:tRNA (mo5U34)-methyltransferase
VFIEHRLAGDPTNWWIVDTACLEAMLRSAGLRVVERPGHELYVCERLAPDVDHAAEMRRVELDAALGLRQDSNQRK